MAAKEQCLSSAKDLEPTLEVLVRQRFAAVHRTTRVVSVEHAGRLFWAKRVVASKAGGWHRVQRFLSLLVPLKILRPTVPAGNGHELREEYRRLENFNKAGIRVPEILGFAGDYFVTAHAGDSLEQAIGKEACAAGRGLLLRRAAAALAALHKAGFCHGRPYLRDMFVTATGEIGFFDLEENPALVMPLATAQARDFWIFTSSAAEWLPDEERQVFVDEYLRSAPEAARQQLFRLVRWAVPLCNMLRFLPLKPGRDLRKALGAGRLLQQSMMPGGSNTQ